MAVMALCWLLAACSQKLLRGKVAVFTEIQQTHAPLTQIGKKCVRTFILSPESVPRSVNHPYVFQERILKIPQSQDEEVENRETLISVHKRSTFSPKLTLT